MSILTSPAPFVNFDLASIVPTPGVAPESDDFRPTAGPDFTPTAEEEAEAAELFADDAEPTDAEWEAMAEDALALNVVCSGLSWL